MATREEIQKAVEENYEAFTKLLPELMKKDAGNYALLRDRDVVELFDSMSDAVKFGNEKYPDGLFSVQHIDATVADLGYFSHAVHVDPL